MNIDTSIYLQGKKYCFISSFGAVSRSVLKPLLNSAIRKDVNSTNNCESVPVKFPKIPICSPPVILNPEYNITVGVASDASTLTIGVYLFDVSKPITPTGINIETDIINYPDNYVSGIILNPIENNLSIDSSSNVNVGYHVFKVGTSTSLLVKDLAGVDITSAFTVVIEGLDKYYYSSVAISPSVLSYKLYI